MNFSPEPNNAGGTEDFTHIVRYGYSEFVPAGTWNDIQSPNVSFPNFEPIQGVVEIVRP